MTEIDESIATVNVIDVIGEEVAAVARADTKRRQLPTHLVLGAIKPKVLLMRYPQTLQKKAQNLHQPGK